MRNLTCDMTVGPITTVERGDETTHSVSLTGKNDDGEFKLTVKERNRDILAEHGIDEVGNKVTVELSPTNSQLTDFGAD